MSLTCRTTDTYEGREHIPAYWRTTLSVIEKQNTTKVPISVIEKCAPDLVHDPNIPRYTDIVLEKIQQLRVICEQLHEGPVETMVISMEPGGLIDELTAIIRKKEKQLERYKAECVNQDAIRVCVPYVFGRCALGATCLQSHTNEAVSTYLQAWLKSRENMLDVDDERETRTLSAKDGFSVEAWCLVLQLVSAFSFNRLVMRSSERGVFRVLNKVLSNNTCSSIKFLEMGKNDLCDRHPGSVVKLAQSLLTNRTLKSLSIGENDLGNLGALCLLSSLKEGMNTTLQYLNLTNNAIDLADAKTGQTVIEALKAATSLRRIGLSNNNVGPRACEQLAAAFMCLPALEYIDLYKTNIGDAGLVFIIDLIKNANVNNPALLALDLSWNDITSESMTAFSSALEGNKTIELLRLASNMGLGRKGAISLSDMLKKNTTLGFLDIRWTCPGDEGVQSLMEALNSNRGIRSMLIQHNDLDPKVEAMANDKLKKRLSNKGKVSSWETMTW
eukprot:PhM_4_TR7881/c0_g1_i1/m.55384